MPANITPINMDTEVNIAPGASLDDLTRDINRFDAIGKRAALCVCTRIAAAHALMMPKAWEAWGHRNWGYSRGFLNKCWRVGRMLNALAEDNADVSHATLSAGSLDKLDSLHRLHEKAPEKFTAFVTNYDLTQYDRGEIRGMVNNLLGEGLEGEDGADQKPPAPDPQKKKAPRWAGALDLLAGLEDEDAEAIASCEEFAPGVTFRALGKIADMLLFNQAIRPSWAEEDWEARGETIDEIQAKFNKKRPSKDVPATVTDADTEE